MHVLCRVIPDCSVIEQVKADAEEGEPFSRVSRGEQSLKVICNGFSQN